MKLHQSVACLMTAVALVGTGVSCKSTNSGADVKGFSYSSSASNVAVLITASSHTPSYGPYFERDMNNFYGIISDPTGNWQFKTSADREATKPSMQAAISAAAAKVSDEGTLLVMVAAHGATNGMLETDQAPGGYANFGYGDVLAAIQQGRQGKPFKRLVLIVSTCYSGSWLSTLQSSAGLIQQRLVITSVGATIESNIGQATGSMLRAFQSYAKTPNLTMRQFLDQTRAIEPNLQYNAIPDAMLEEPLINPATLPNKPTATATDPATSTDSGVAAGTPAATGTDTATAADGSIEAHTASVNGQVVLVVSTKADCDKVELLNSTDGKWYAYTGVYQAISGYAVTVGINVGPRYTTVDSVTLRVTAAGNVTTSTVPVSHN